MQKRVGGREKTRIGENWQLSNRWFCKVGLAKGNIARFWEGEGLFNIMTNYGQKNGNDEYRLMFFDLRSD